MLRLKGHRSSKLLEDGLSDGQTGGRLQIPGSQPCDQIFRLLLFHPHAFVVDYHLQFGVETVAITLQFFVLGFDHDLSILPRELVSVFNRHLNYSFQPGFVASHQSVMR